MKKYYKFEMNLKFLNIFTFILFFGSYIILKILGYDIWNNTFNFNLLIYIFAWFILHEIIHGIGFLLFGKNNSKNIVFGIELEKGIFYCMCKQVINKLNIIAALILPLITIGFITLLIGILFNSNLLILLSILNIAGASGDIMMTIAIIKMRNIEYLDTDDTTSFYILSEDDISNKKYLGLNIVDNGIYDPNIIKAKDYTRIKVTKISWYVIIILIIIMLLINFF